MIRRPPESQPAAREAFERLCKAEVRTDADALVYADWLTEQGSSWGEFITASRHGDLKRARALLETDRARWLGRLAPFLEAHPGEFVDGLPEVARVATTSVDELLEHARATEWLLFREVQLRTGGSAVVAPLLASPALRRLRSARGLTVPLLSAVVEQGALGKLRELGCAGDPHRPAPFPTELLAHFTRLETFIHEGSRLHANDVERFIDLQAPRLRRLELIQLLTEEFAWDALADAPHTVPDLVVAAPRWQREKDLRMRLWGAPRFERVELYLGAKFERALPLQLELLRRLRLKDREVVVVPARAFSAAERALVLDHLGPRSKSVVFAEQLQP